MLFMGIPPHKIGGIAEHVSTLSRALARRGKKVHVVTPVTPSSMEDYEQEELIKTGLLSGEKRVVFI
ncbi:hypothetical protein DRN80_03980 [Methanosarcinales archaeon]|nr:MAG: hypothetical protein DRN80_03980 [Methanosarcinales archaeon]